MDADSFWERVSGATFANEADVEVKLVLPLLEALGYRADDIAAKYPVVFQEGRRGRKHEADFVVFDGPRHDLDTSLLVVEAKRPDESLAKGKQQAASYAAALKAPLYISTNGRRLEVWQYQLVRECSLALDIAIAEMSSRRGQLEGVLSRERVVSFCKGLLAKSIAEHAVQTQPYEDAAVRRLEPSSRASTRTLVTVGDQTGAALLSSQVVATCTQGAIISASSGLGKSTLMARLTFDGLRLRARKAEAPVPVDVFLPDVPPTTTIVDFLAARLDAHCPGTTRAIMNVLLRNGAVTLMGDGFDRLSLGARQWITAQLRLLMQDFPRTQVFVATRPDAIPEIGLPVLLLQRLTATEQRSIAGEDEMKLRRFHALSPFHRRLAEHPLLLRQMLDSSDDLTQADSGILPLFDSWLRRTLASPGSLETFARRDAALRHIALATTDAPLTITGASLVLQRAGLGAGALDDLGACGSLSIQEGTIEVTHEGLADFIRARSIASLPESEQETAVNATAIREGAFFPVLLGALLSKRHLQKRLWIKVAESGLEALLGALYLRADLSQEMASLDPTTATERFLEDLLDGVGFLTTNYFPHIAPRIHTVLTLEYCDDIGAVGHLDVDSGQVHYGYVPRAADEPRTSAAAEGHDFPLRFTNLVAYKVRIDGGMRLGLRDGHEVLKELVEHQLLDGGPIWTEELLVSRLRLLEHYENFAFRGRTLAHLYDELSERAGEFVCSDAPYRRREGVFIGEVLMLIQRLTAFGHNTPLELWWEASDGAGANDATKGKNMATHFRRSLLAYREVVEQSLPNMAKNLANFPALPVRYKVTLVRTKLNATIERETLYWAYLPVRSWDDAGADVAFALERPTFESTIADELEEQRKKLSEMGRVAPYFTVPFFSPPPSFGGYHLRGSFDGLTSVVREVTEMLEQDLKKLFENLRL